MSGTFDEPDQSEQQEPPQRSSRSRALVITAAVLVVAFIALTGFSSFWTERLWFGSVGYSEVFSTLLWTRVGLFLVFGGLMAAVVALNICLAYRFRPFFLNAAAADLNLERYRDAITPIMGWLLAGISLLMGAFAGASATGPVALLLAVAARPVLRHARTPTSARTPASTSSTCRSGTTSSTS